MRRFLIQPADPLSPEFAEIVACEIASFNTPYQSIFRFFYPIFGGESSEEKNLALEDLIEQQRQWARDDPDSIWLKAIDTENNNKLVGGLLMKIHMTNPFAGDKLKEKSSAVWYPPGSQREYIDQCLEIFSAPREKFMQRPHVYFYIGFVDPEYRGHHVPNLLFEEECRRADELGLEAYLEATTPLAVQIYMRHGFIPYGKVSVEPKKENADDEWKDMEKKMQPLQFCPMWRPKYGQFVPGKTQLPWDGYTKEMPSKL
ncbi:hypothetical protein BDW68DRAFT_99297 [Aspergillus falconensis]